MQVDRKRQIDDRIKTKLARIKKKKYSIESLSNMISNETDKDKKLKLKEEKENLTDRVEKLENLIDSLLDEKKKIKH